MKTIKTFASALGGYSYRVTADSKSANLQERSPGSNSWRTGRTMARADFDAAAERVGLFDSRANSDNPAVVRAWISAA